MKKNPTAEADHATILSLRKRLRAFRRDADAMLRDRGSYITELTADLERVSADLRAAKDAAEKVVASLRHSLKSAMQERDEVIEKLRHELRNVQDARDEAKACFETSCRIAQEAMDILGGEGSVVDRAKRVVKERDDALAWRDYAEQVNRGLIDDAAKLRAAVEELEKPIRIRLLCPGCAALHIDEGEWAARPHKTHECQNCGLQWRPCNRPTVGVRFLEET